MLLKEGFDRTGRKVAEFFICRRENCNCVGQWTSGNPEQVVHWEDTGEHVRYLDKTGIDRQPPKK